MIASTLTVYRCSYCRHPKLYQLQHACERHERHCWANPDRVPMPGELTQGASDLCPDTPPSWWPGATWSEGRGRLFLGDEGWVPVTGYRWDKRRCEDLWPDAYYYDIDTDAGPRTRCITLDKLSREERLDWYRAELQETTTS